MVVGCQDGGGSPAGVHHGDGGHVGGGGYDGGARCEGGDGQGLTVWMLVVMRIVYIDMGCRVAGQP